jgi:hypothetical protein
MYPSLVEPTIKCVLQSELKHCQDKRLSRSSTIFNIVCFAVLVGGIGFMLWYQYKDKQDTYANWERERKKRDYIMSKLQVVQKMNQRMFTNLPTNLPM